MRLGPDAHHCERRSEEAKFFVTFVKALSYVDGLQDSVRELESEIGRDR